jgi:pectinesterase
MLGKKIVCLSLLACLVMSGLNVASASSAVLITVDQSGNGDYSKIQDAIDSVPSNNSVQTFILIAPGVYR